MYQALYRKYRPKDFNSVVGQDSIIKTLKNSIINHNFSHAYIFFGPRGTGKTTVSKIFARNINCLSPVEGIACGECDACKVSFSKECIDIIEIDAASNNGVDEIRELKNNINLVPSELKYKVYIIDEVHMLSAGAFNALLKTLEEPPEHAIFILATTDPQKVPDTIVSRCQCFSFKRISDSVIEKRLEFVCSEENISADPSVLNKIALFSDGGLRDALGSLDKLVSYAGNSISIDDFNEINGTISDEDLNSFLKAIFNGDISTVLSSITDFNNTGKNLIQIIVQIINYARNLVVDYFLNEKNCEFSIDLLQNLINSLNEKMFDIRSSGNTKVYIEMFLLKFINDYVIEINDMKNSVVDKRVSTTHSTNNVNDSSSTLNENTVDIPTNSADNNSIRSEENVNQNSNLSSDPSDSDDDFDFNSYMSDDEDNFNEFDNNINNDDSISSIPTILNIDDVITARINNTFVSANKDLLKKENANFDLLKDFSFDQEIGYLVNSLLDSTIRVVGENDFIISYDSDAAVNQNLSNIIKLNEVYNKITNSNKNIAIISDEKWNVLKNEYISNLKNNVKYEYVDEPEFIIEENKKDDIIVNSAVSLFGEDIVEFE